MYSKRGGLVQLPNAKITPVWAAILRERVGGMYLYVCEKGSEVLRSGGMMIHFRSSICICTSDLAITERNIATSGVS
jgi:hypothetical protein